MRFDRSSFPYYAAGSLVIAASVLAIGVAVKFAKSAWLGVPMQPWTPTATSGLAVDLFGLLVLSPVFESVIFLLVGRAYRDWKHPLNGVANAMTMAVLGFVLHLPTDALPITQALGYAVFAVWFWHVATQRGHKFAFIVVAITHALANSPFAILAFTAALP